MSPKEEAFWSHVDHSIVLENIDANKPAIVDRNGVGSILLNVTEDTKGYEITQ